MKPYVPGELSLLFNPEAPPDIYEPPPPPPPVVVTQPPKKQKKSKRQQQDDESDEEQPPSKKAQTKNNKKTDQAENSTKKSKKEKKTDKKKQATEGEEEGGEGKEGKKEKKTKKPFYPKENDPRLPRTVFVGNLPVSVDKKTVEKLFGELGKIESIRFRSVAFSDPKLPKKAAFAKKLFHEQRNSMNAYIVFENEDSVAKAVEWNGKEISGNIVRVDYADKAKVHDTRNSIFIGNLHFDIVENELREHFQECGTITNVRIIRDPKLNIGKGFAFVTFKEADAVVEALKLNDSKLKDRNLRIKRALKEARLQQLQKRRNVERRLSEKDAKKNSKKGGKKEQKSKTTKPSKKDSTKPKKNKQQPDGATKKAAKKQKTTDAKLPSFAGVQATKSSQPLKIRPSKKKGGAAGGKAGKKKKVNPEKKLRKQAKKAERGTGKEKGKGKKKGKKD